MLDVISKADYFDALNREDLHARLREVSPHQSQLNMKHVQDAWILLQLLDVRSKRILEVGGGHSRVLRCLDPSNERVNLDRLEGRDGGPKAPPKTAGVRNILARLGEFSDELEAGYFDIVTSISVMEHIPVEAYPAYWQDHARIMKAGGVGYHAVDVYLTDHSEAVTEARIDMYLNTLAAAGLRLAGPNTLERPLQFRSTYASNTDYCMWIWNRIAPSSSARRFSHQCVSLRLVVTKD